MAQEVPIEELQKGVTNTFAVSSPDAHAHERDTTDTERAAPPAEH